MIPDKFRESMELKIMGNTINILTLVNGDKMTIELNGKEITVPDKAKESTEGRRATCWTIARLVTLKDKKYELSPDRRGQGRGEEGRRRAGVGEG